MMAARDVLGDDTGKPDRPAPALAVWHGGRCRTLPAYYVFLGLTVIARVVTCCERTMNTTRA